MSDHKTEICSPNEIQQASISGSVYSSVFFNTRDLNKYVFIGSGKEHQEGH